MTRAVAAVACSLALAGCSDTTDPASPLVFGDTEGACGVTVLINDIGDEERLGAVVGCLIDHFDNFEPVEWDLLVPTIEGDPILNRFEGDGSQITIIEDTTRDAFGSGAVVVRTCQQIDDTGFVPAGSDCVESRGDPFELPNGIWPP